MNLFKKVKEVKNTSKEQLGKELNGLIGEANSMGSDIVGKMFLARLTFKLESSQKYANSEEQVDVFLEKYPNMMIYREEIIKKARDFRKEHGLSEMNAQEKL